MSMTFDEYLDGLEMTPEERAAWDELQAEAERFSPRILRITWTNAPLPESVGATDVTLTYTVREGR